MSEYYLRVDEHTPMLLKALIKYSPYRQNYLAKELLIKTSNLSSYLNGKKKMSKELCANLLRLLGFNPSNPYIKISNKLQLINK